MSRRLSLAEADAAFTRAGLPARVRPLGHWHADGNHRLADLAFDNSPSSFMLWDLVLSEEERLRAARANGGFIVGAMKDLGTIPVLVDAIPGARAFYPDAAWWLPCLQRHAGGQLETADRLGIGEAFCPVRAMLGCYADGSGFPAPDLDICAVGATCDDFSAIAQRLAGLGRPILWWELPPFRAPDPGEAAVVLPDGQAAPAALVHAVAAELGRVRDALQRAAGVRIDDAAMAAAVARANAVRATVRAIRQLAFAAPRAPIPAIELLLVEALALHFCSDVALCQEVLAAVHATVTARAAAGDSHLAVDAVRTCWVNPVADLRALGWLEDAGGRLCGSDFMTAQALAPIPTGVPPLEALAHAALCDRMIGSDRRRARLAAAEARCHGAEAAVVARIPGSSHGCSEGAALARELAGACPLPTTEFEVPTLADADAGRIRGRLDALMETARGRRSIPP
jgi:hypothetical protein